MRSLVRVSLFFFVLIYTGFKAQDVVTRDTLSGTELIYSTDSNIGKMMDEMEERCLMVTKKPVRSDGDATSKSTPAISRTPTTRVVANRELTNAEICRQNPRILGYKIQLTVVKSNEEANEVKAFFRRRFPSIKAETDASLRPNYKILVGSYFTRQSAASDLAKIKPYFNSAIAVQYRVFCVEAK